MLSRLVVVEFIAAGTAVTVMVAVGTVAAGIMLAGMVTAMPIASSSANESGATITTNTSGKKFGFATELTGVI